VRRRISSPALVGRAAELALLDELLAGARAGAPALCVVSGEAGVGKTRLARELERRAAAAGMLCLRGQCLALAGGEFPFAPLVGIFRGLAAARGPAALEALDAGARRLLQLQAAGPGDGEPPAPAIVHASVVEALRRLAATEPAAILVEDVHWADESTRDFLQVLVRGLSEEKLLVLATFRTDELPGEHPARALLAEMARWERVCSLELGRLSREQTARQLEAIAGHEVAPEALQAIHARAQGNPFLAEELWAARAGAGQDAIPASLGDALLARVRRLPADTQAALRLLAVFGRPVGAELAAVAAAAADKPAGSDPDTTAAALRRAADAHVLVPGEGGRTLTFRHALVREALYGELMPGEREALHRSVAEALAATSGGGVAAELAYHHLAAGRRPAALVASIDAGLEEVRLTAYPEALAHFERALELWESVEPDADPALDRADLHREAAEAARLVGEYERAIEHCRAALEHLDVTRDPVRVACVYALLGRFQSWDAERSLAELDRALALLGPDPAAEHACVMTTQSLMLGLLGRRAEARDRAGEALAAAEAAGAEREACRARSELGLAQAFMGDLEGGERSLRAALQAAEELRAAEEVARGWTYLAELERLRGRSRAALAAMQEGRHRAVALGASASWGAFMAVLSADDLFHLGFWDDLDALLETTASVNAGRPGAVAWPLVAGQLALARGEVEEAAALLERARECALRGVTTELLPHVGAALAELELARGDAPAARARVAEMLKLIGGHEDVINTPVLYGAGARAEAQIAVRALRSRDAAAAKAARERAHELTASLAALVSSAPGDRPPPRAAACLEQAKADLAPPGAPAAAAQWARAAAAWEALGHPYPAAWARLRHAELLLTGRRAQRRASRSLELAHAHAARLGATVLLADIEALARRARVPVAAAPARPDKDDETLGLTPREAEVLRLIADGLTNRQIGEKLFITPKTAGLHVSRILAKLNVDSRVKAAALAHRAGLAEPDPTAEPGLR
jgi:DNA-binding CsgD family transcriptional regulator/tetratricopeptide (TPR) repeat protein